MLPITLLLAVAASTATASWPGTPCMSSAQATQVAHFWPQLIGNYSKKLAEETLTDDYADYSESALSLNAECPRVNGTAPPLTAPVFTSRQQFEMGQGSQPPIDSQILNIWPACREVTLRYDMTNLGTRPVITNIAVVAVPGPKNGKYPWVISTTYSEFDSAAWVQNLKDSNEC